MSRFARHDRGRRQGHDGLHVRRRHAGHQDQRLRPASASTNWPFVTTDSVTPEVKGVTGTVGTIDTPDGKKQVTLNGWPLYYFAGDSKPGDTNGQGVGGILVGPEPPPETRSAAQVTATR